MKPQLGQPLLRPDGVAKATGEFTYAGDLSVPGMLHGATLRSPHPSARLVGIDVSAAYNVPGVVAVVTAADVPGTQGFGLDIADQPVFVCDVTRYYGEAVAAVAAESPAAARRGVRAIECVWEVLPTVTDPEVSLSGSPLHPAGNLYRHLLIEHGDPAVHGEVVVEGTYEVGVQDQAFLAPEAALAVPAPDGGVDVQVATQWLHADQRQMAECLDLPPEKVRLTLAGVGGAFGGREDVSLQIHVCLLALKTSRPVKMVYSRADSFLGHVHRHPARMHYVHTATRDGRLVSVSARIMLDGGAYQSSSWAVVGNAGTMALGPYVVPNARIEALSTRTNNPPSGAMRGFGCVQVCIGHEAQMDKLAAALDLDPLHLREINAIGPGDRLPTGQRIEGSAPVRELLSRIAAQPLPSAVTSDHPALQPGGQGNCSDSTRVRRGVGLALGFKNIAFSEGYDDPSTARVRLEIGPHGRPQAVVHSACVEVGQGFVTIVRQIVHAELGVEDVVLLDADTTIDSAGSTSASRQTWVSGGAVQLAAKAVADELVARVASKAGLPQIAFTLQNSAVVGVEASLSVPLSEALAAGPVQAERTYRHRRTSPLDQFGQGDAHVAWSFVAHRAVVDVDLDLGTVRLVQLATAQDVGRALNPLSVIGQLEGGTAQGVGLALTEELVLDNGRVVGPGFGDYLLLTTLDLPDLLIDLVEEPEPGAPYGAKGVGEAPTVSSPAAVASALRDATGLALARLPVRPEHMVTR